MAIPSGTVIAGRYKIVRLLGEGGFGAVYLAEDSRLGDKPVAVKESFDKSPEAQEQFRLEAQLLANLQHPSLPRVTDHFLEPDGRQFLVMDYIEGDDLDQRVISNGRAMPEREAASWMVQVCEAVAYLHTRRPQPIIHRDIKPANIKITREGRAMLVDFGIAKVYHPSKGTAKVAKAVTPHFSPPEQHVGRTDTRSDVYSLGATLYMTVCAEVPPDAMERLNQGSFLVPPSQINPAISPTLDGIIMKSLDLHPEQRFLNANRMAAALRNFLNGQPVDLGGATCPRCGWQNRQGARFCIKDGAPLAPAPGLASVLTPSAPAQPPEMLFEIANAYARNRDFAQAIPRYEACLNQGFTNQAVYFNLGLCYLDSGRVADAAAILEKGAAQYPQDGDIQGQLARAYQRLHQPEKALSAALRACQLDPSDAGYQRHYGTLLFEAGRYSEAVRALEQSVQLDPNSLRSSILLGRAYLETNDPRRAIQVLRQAAHIDAKSPEPHLWVGIAHVQNRRYREAVAAFEDALRLDPNYAPAWYWTGEALLMLNQYSKALPNYQKAVALNPHEPTYHTRLAQCYVSLRRRSEAQAALQQALQIDPGYQPARDLMKRI